MQGIASGELVEHRLRDQRDATLRAIEAPRIVLRVFADHGAFRDAAAAVDHHALQPALAPHRHARQDVREHREIREGGASPLHAVGLGAAIDYLQKVGMSEIANHEHRLTERALDGLIKIPGLTVIGPKTRDSRGAVISFTVDGIHPHDLGQVLDDKGIAVRTGHHCAWPLMQALKVQSTTRASFYLYNTEDEVDQLVDGVIAAKKFFKV